MSPDQKNPEPKTSYLDLLKHPQWQKKRLDVMQRAEFRCENCGSEEKTLHVHHSYYEKGKFPWDYPDESLCCLCDDCHGEAQDTKALLNRQLGKLVPQGGMDQLLGYAMALEAKSFPVVTINIYSYEFAQGVGDCWGLRAEEIIAALQDGVIDGYKLHELSNAKRSLRSGT